jgi:hypothetical protein
VKLAQRKRETSHVRELDLGFDTAVAFDIVDRSPERPMDCTEGELVS